MAASYKDMNTILTDPTSPFAGRCACAAAVAAMSVMGESVTVQDHQARADFCRKLLSGGVPAANIAAAVATQSTVTAVATVANLTTDAGVSDAIILATMPTVLPALAGLANHP